MDHILVTGGAGYVGSHACKVLAQAGYVPVVYDNLSTGWAEAVKFGPFVQGDLADRALLDETFARYRPKAVMHFAALSLVGVAMQDPGLYWRTNVLGSLNLIEAAVASGCLNFVFSSTCATYGDHDGVVLDEVAFAKARSEPTERMIFEHSPAISLAPIAVRWDDIGAWAAVYDVNPKCGAGNVTLGDVLLMDTTNSLVRANGRLVVVVGMNDVVVVDTKDALLVTDRAHTQQVKQVVEALKSTGRSEVVSHLYHERSWGGVEDLLSKASYKLEMLTIRPGLTARINGHGLGASFLAVVTGEGSYLEGRAEPCQSLQEGSVLSIDRHTEISLTNMLATDLQALLLSMSKEQSDVAMLHRG